MLRSLVPRTARSLAVPVVVLALVLPASPALADGETPKTDAGDAVVAAPVDVHDDAPPVIASPEGDPAPAESPAAAGEASVQAAAAPPVPSPPVPFRTAPEEPARYVGQVSCESTVKPGTSAFRQMIIATYGSSSVGTLRACSVGARSEHKDGRALDWMLNVSTPGDKAKADAFLAWLLGPDAQGVQAGNAHRLGVMYLIWDRRQWGSWSGTWKPYTGTSPHTDHIHISLSWDGAMKRTSWWTGVRTERYDYGSCQEYVGEPAPTYSGPRYTPCPAPVERRSLAFPRLWDADNAADVLAANGSGQLRMYGGSGTGGFSSARQIGHGWGSMSLVTMVGDLDGDGSRDLVARSTTGLLYLYQGDGSGSFRGAVQIGHGWGGMDLLLGPGDMDGDGSVDILARRSGGALLLYPGNSFGGLRPGREIGALTGQDLVTAVGDWDGDSYADLISRQTSTGLLMLHRGDGRGGLRSPVVVGTGWGDFNELVGSGDFTGDKYPDLLGRRSDGRLMLYRGTGSGGFRPGSTQIGHGWGTMSILG